MKKRIEKIMVVAFSVMLVTPILNTPKISIPNIQGSVKLSNGVQKSIQDYVKGLNFKFTLN